jgi:WD40 repeat protein
MMQRAARRPATAEAARRLNQSLLASVAVDRDEGDYGIIRYHYLLPFARGGRRLTAEQKRLARACKAVECISGSWDRRGRRLALSGVTDEDDPWLGILARGSRIHAVKGGLRGLRGEDPAAVWAPDGRSLALEGDNSIRRLDLASGRNRRLALGAQPAWSVLGLIAFNRARGTYLMRPDGRNTRKIRGWGALGPYSWSPDGTRLAFCDRGDIATMSVDGRNVRHLTHGAAIDCKPAWSPDGRSIAFVRDEVEIWEVPTRGGNARRFTSRSAFDDLASGDGEALTILRLSWRAAG